MSGFVVHLHMQFRLPLPNSVDGLQMSRHPHYLVREAKLYMYINNSSTVINSSKLGF